MNYYEEAVRNYVCSHCVDFGSDGICHSKDPEGCAIFRHLPQLIEIAERIHDVHLVPYSEEVRKRICTSCRNQHPEGKCSVRESLSCALDCYLPLVLEAIEDAKVRKARRESWNEN